MTLSPGQLEQFDRDGYLFFPGLFTAEEIAGPARRGAAALRRREAGERAREGQRRGAHQLRRAPVQRARSPGSARHPRMVEPVDADPAASRCTCTSSRSTARWPSTATSGSGTRTTAPGRTTTCMPERAGHERGDLPRRRERVQRPADVHPRQPQAGRDRRRARPDDDQLSAVDDRPRHHPQARRRAAASSRPRARPAR